MRTKVMCLLSSIIIVVALVVLLYPMIPVERTILKTRTRNLQYNSEEFYPTIDYSSGNYGYYVNVTNTDSVDGVFTVTINYLNINRQPTDNLVKSVYIGSGETAKFAPEGMATYYSYTVSTPSVQESYSESQTEYKSVLNYLIEK